MQHEKDIKSESKILLQHILRFEKLTQRAEIILRDNFQLDEHPIIAAAAKKISRHGELNSSIGILQYRFHGNGCEIIYPTGEVVDYNYDTKSWTYSGLDVYSLRNFIDSTGESGWDMNKIRKIVNDLEREGAIYRPIEQYEKYKTKFVDT